MYKVLHILSGGDYGGIASVVFNYYHHIDRCKVEFAVALTGQMGEVADRFKKIGVKIYLLPIKSEGIHNYEKILLGILKNEHYDAVHVHENETSYIALRIAKKAGVKYRFAHSHTSSPYHSAKSEIKRLSGCVLNYHYATKVIACGKLAGERVFGRWNMRRRKAVVLPNAIDTERFAYDEQIRIEMRNALDIRDKYVIGMVARLSKEKNHVFALKIIKRFHDLHPKAVAILVGNGSEENDLRNTVAANKMEDYVKFLGIRNDVDKLCQAFDILLMPSFHEGFPVASVEAMSSGLPVLLSDTITKELNFGSAVRYIALNDDERWIRALEEMMNDQGRVHRISEVKEHNLDIRDTVRILEQIYLDKT